MRTCEITLEDAFEIEEVYGFVSAYLAVGGYLGFLEDIAYAF